MLNKKMKESIQALTEKVVCLRSRISHMEQHLCIGEDGQYRAEIKCNNCGEYNDVVIPRQYTVEGFLEHNPDKKRVCWKCGIEISKEPK